MDKWQEEQVQSLLSAENEALFFNILSGITAKLGFDYCAYGMRLPLPITQPKLIMLNNYSPAWQQRYIEANYLAVDPTVAHGMRSTTALVWTEDVFSKHRPFWEDAKSHGLSVGLAQSCHDAQGIGGLLSLGRANDHLTKRELEGIVPQISWLTQMAHQGLSRLLIPEHMPEASIHLTVREVDVLRWTADGKTSNEVGRIMNISERTVNFHVNNVLLKLGVSNKTAAAIKAAILGFL